MESGTVLADRYRLDRRLGRGAIGEVWVGRDLRLNRDVAVKVLRDADPTEAEVRRFTREAMVAAGLQHPGITVVFDADAHDGHASARGSSQSFVPPGEVRQRLFCPVGIRAEMIVPGQVIDPHGEQDGTIHQEVTLGGSDIPPVSLLAEDRAHVLKRVINGKHCEHGSHLHLRHTATGHGRSRALVLLVVTPQR